MCDCLAWHPLWADIARTSRTRRETIAFVVLYLQAAPDQPVARDARTIAGVIGGSLERAARIMLALREAEVVDDANRLAGEWAKASPMTRRNGHGDAVTVTDDAGDLLVTPGDVSAAARRREVSRRSSAKYRAKLRGTALSETNYPQSYPVTAGDAAQEEDRDPDFLWSSFERARERVAASEAAQTIDPRTLRRQKLYERALAAAPQQLSEREHAKLLEQMTDERYQRFLARGTGALPPWVGGILERLFKATEWRGGGAQPAPRAADRRQGWMPLPLPGGGGQPDAISTQAGHYRETG